MVFFEVKLWTKSIKIYFYVDPFSPWFYMESPNNLSKFQTLQLWPKFFGILKEKQFGNQNGIGNNMGTWPTNISEQGMNKNHPSVFYVWENHFHSIRPTEQAMP